MFGNEEVKMEWFIEGPTPKAKLNWFLYEVALEYHAHIMHSKALSQYRKTQNEAKIAEFCAYFAKRMKKSVLERLAGLTDATEIDEEYISNYYPKNSRKMNGLLLEAACLAWDKLLSGCENCPTRCLSEKEQYCTLFDTYTS